jgi:hypothetical protein
MRKWAYLFVAANLWVSQSLSAQEYSNFGYSMPDVTFQYSDQRVALQQANQAAMNMLKPSSSKSSTASATFESDTSNFPPTYTPSKSVRKKNLANFVAKTRATDPAGAAQMEQLFASGDIIDQIDGMMQAKGLSVSNTADAYAVWWINAWEVANGITSGESSSRQLKAVSAQAARGFASTTQFTNATDAQKQEMAEAMLVQAALIDASKETYANDPDMMAKLSAAVKQGAKKSGLDLDAMTLTEDGFVKAKGRKTGAAGDTSKAANPNAPTTAIAANASGKGEGKGEGDTNNTLNYALIAAAAGAGLGSVFLFGKAMGRRG